MTTHHKNKTSTNRTRLEIQVERCYLNEGIDGSYYRVFCRDRADNHYTFSSSHSYMAYQPWEWVEVEAQISETFLHWPLKVVSIEEARRLGVPIQTARTWGFLIDLKKRDKWGWIEEIRPAAGKVTEDDVAFSFPGEHLRPDGLTADQEQAAWADFYGLYDETFSHPNEKIR